jgi:hypothetical protein
MASTTYIELAPASDQTADGELRDLVIHTLQHDPRASFEQIFTRLRARTGRTILAAESLRLRMIYEVEGYAAGASRSRSGEAARVASLATFVHYRPNAKELTGLAAGLIPFLIHYPSITLPRSTASVGATASYFDFVALAGGVAALAAAYGAGSLATRAAQRLVHVAVTVAIALLGLYQVLLGLGLLHRIGLYHFS